jgi:Flp pilus assembly protein TadG
MNTLMRTPRISVMRRRIRRDERGAALLEFALVFGLFVFVLYALIAFGLILSTKNSITHAAAEGARSAIGVTDNTATSNDERVDAAKARVAQSLDWLGSKYVASDSPDPVIAHCTNSTSPTATCITVKVVYPYDLRPLVSPAPGLGLVTPSSFSATAVVELTP